MKYIFAIIIAALAFSASAQQALVGSWTGKLNVGAVKLTLVLNIGTDDNGAVQCTLDSPDQGVKGIPATVDYCADDSVKVSIRQIGASYGARLAGEELKGSFMQMGQSFPLDMKKGVEEVKRPQTPVEPFPYKTEEVDFTSLAETATLSGTLTYPVDYEKMNPADVPVVLMVSGSGLQNRDEEIMGHKPFLVIADYLARNGIASLRYDDRATGKSTGGDVKNATTLDFAHDAEAGCEKLKLLKKFGKIGILGHSEGGNIAFILASRDKADFVVSLAGVGVKGDTALTAQANCVMRLNGMPGTADTKQYRNMVLLQNQPWLTWFINYDPSQHIAATHCPVFAAGGDKDCQVIAGLNLGGIRATLPAGDQNRIVEYPGLNHLFQECTTGGPDEYGKIEQTISPQVLKDITEWIKKLK